MFHLTNVSPKDLRNLFPDPVIKTSTVRDNFCLLIIFFQKKKLNNSFLDKLNFYLDLNLSQTGSAWDVAFKKNYLPSDEIKKIETFWCSFEKTRWTFLDLFEAKPLFKWREFFSRNPFFDFWSFLSTKSSEYNEKRCQDTASANTTSFWLFPVRLLRTVVTFA